MGYVLHNKPGFQQENPVGRGGGILRGQLNFLMQRQLLRAMYVPKRGKVPLSSGSHASSAHDGMGREGMRWGGEG